MTTKSNLLSLRYIIYMNVPLLYSIYSQVFEGITDRITEEKIIQAITSNTEGIPLLSSRGETASSDTSRHVESGILHDHMYSRLEERLAHSFVDGSQIAAPDLTTTLINHQIVKVSGQTEIEDYERLVTYLHRFNEIIEVIAYAGKSDDEHKNKVTDLLVKLSEKPKENLRKEYQLALDKLINAIPKAKEINLLQDSVLLNHLSKFIEIFNHGAFNVVVTPNSSKPIHYRGVLDKTWLRISPDLISSMYGGQSAAPWTMVGIVTNIQGTYTKHEDSKIMSNPENPMMLDAFRNIFRSTRAFERMFLESDTGLEVMLSPLAIYREIAIDHP